MITLNLNYTNGKYFMKIKSVDDHQLKTLLQSFQIESYPLEITEKESYSKAFPIRQNFQIPILKYTDYYFEALHKQLIEYKNKQYYIKIGLHGSKLPNFFLSLSFAIFYKDSLDNEIKTLFEANVLKKDNNILKLDKPLCQNMEFQEKKKRYSNSVPYKEIKSFINKKGYSLSDIKNIDYLYKSITSKIFGLKNLGNTCFLNSSLQILIHSPLFIKRFLEDCIKLNEKNIQNTLIYEFFNLIMEINSNNSNVFSPNKFISSFLNKCNLFSLGQQSDSQRFYRNLLNIFEKELGSQNNCVRNTFVGEMEYKNIYICSGCYCGYSEQKNSKQIFYDIIASPSAGKITIADMLNTYYGIKNLHSSQTCECKNYLHLTRKTTIRPNEYLSVNIQKGQIETRTIKNFMITITNLKIKDIIYEAYAINFHTGTSIDSGHYYR